MDRHDTYVGTGGGGDGVGQGTRGEVEILPVASSYKAG